jgi:hypothetical protein
MLLRQHGTAGGDSGRAVFFQQISGQSGLVYYGGDLVDPSALLLDGPAAQPSAEGIDRRDGRGKLAAPNRSGAGSDRESRQGRVQFAGKGLGSPR